MGRKKIDIEKLVSLHSQGLDDPEIAKILNCSQCTVTDKRIVLKLPRNISNPNIWFLREPFNTDIKTLYENGYSDVKIVKLMRKDGINIRVSNVVYWRTRNKLPEGNSDSLEQTDIKGSDSLFCDTEFLERYFKKSLDKKECD